MTNHIKTISIALAALAGGLILGYFLFRQNSDRHSMHQHDQQQETTVPSEGEDVWTCSMHPQIRQNEAGDCPICGMALSKLDQNASDDPLVLKMTEESVKLASIQTAIVGSGNINANKTLRLSGKVQADERLASSQVAHVPGRIEKLYVTFTGEQIKKGQKLADLYSPELITAQQELLEALRLQEVNPGLLEAARNKLRYWKISESLVTKIETEGNIQETFPVYADASGIVTQRRVAVGDHLKQGEPLFDLINLSRVWVLFDAYEADLASISLGSTITFNTPAIPNQDFRSRVTFIDPVINPQSRVAAVRVEITNSRGILKPEMLVYGSLENKTSANTDLVVPKSAVLWTGSRSVVYVKMPDIEVPSFQFREINIGQPLGDNYQVISGLEVGEEVVTNGSFVIDAAAQLNNQASMMNQHVLQKEDEQLSVLPNYIAETPLVFKQQLSGLVDQYLLLKDALVATDAQTASEQAEQVLASITAIDSTLLAGEASAYWLEQLTALEAHAAKIQQLSDDVEAQRKQFDFVSAALINCLKVFGSPENVYYVQHCPMAFDDTGANWLSAQEKILNPYFGEQMLSCGIIKETIDAN